jgi:hypothetical protein
VLQILPKRDFSSQTAGELRQLISENLAQRARLAGPGPSDLDDFFWTGFVVTADNLTGDAWYSPITLYPTTVVEY